MKHHLFRTLLLVALSFAGTVYAVTLGQPKVISFLGQPLEVEIDLIGLEPDQRQDLNLRIANDRHFERLGVSHTELLDALTFDVVESDGRWMVRVRTKNPVSEHYLDFPLQVRWTGGQLIKRYTLLLEPLARTQPTLVTSKSRAALDATHPPTARASDSYGPVRRGEILTAVAQRLKPLGTTTWQMSIVLYRTNPHAFTDGNINKLRVGSVLAIPGRDVIERLDNPSAISAFAAETTRWLARTESSPKKPAAAPTVAVAPAPAPADEAPLHVVADNDTTNAYHDGGLYQQLLVAMEDVETLRITNDSVETRMARVEARLAGMQMLIQRKDAQIAAANLEAATRRALPAAQTAAPPQIGNVPPTTRPWHAGYLWVTWVALGLVVLMTLLVMRRRSYIQAEEVYVAELPVAGRDDASPRPQTGHTPSVAEICEAEKGLDSPQEQRACESAEPGTPADGVTEKAPPHVNNITPRDETPDPEDAPHPEPGHAAEWTPDIDEVELASWAAELDEDIEQTGEQEAYNDTIELQDEQPDHSDDEPIQLDDDIPIFLTEFDDPLPTEVPAPTSIPDPIEIELTSDTYGGAGLIDHVDSVSGTDEDFSLSLDLARAYLEIGDPEAAEEILKRALARAPDPEPQRQMEELLTKIA